MDGPIRIPPDVGHPMQHSRYRLTIRREVDRVSVQLDRWDPSSDHFYSCEQTADTFGEALVKVAHRWRESELLGLGLRVPSPRSPHQLNPDRMDDRALAPVADKIDRAGMFASPQECAREVVRTVQRLQAAHD